MSDGPIYSMLTGKGPLPGGGQTLTSFTLSGAPIEWGSYPVYNNGMNNFPGDINGVYVDENAYYGGNGPQPGSSWVSSNGNWMIYYSSSTSSCTCYDASDSVLGTRQLPAGWRLYFSLGGTTRAYASGTIASIPPTTDWYHLFKDNQFMDDSCSRNVLGSGEVRGFQDCDPSVLPPTSPYHPGYVASLTFTPV